LFGSATALGVTFWVPTHAPNHLVTYFESVSAFLSYLAPGYPGRDLPLESYLSQRRLWGGRGSSRVRLPYTGAITMALKPPFPSLYCCSLPPWPFIPMGIREPHCDCLALTLFNLATRSPRRRLVLATPWLTTLALSVSSPRQRLALTLTPIVDFDLDLVNARVRNGTKPVPKLDLCEAELW